MLKSKITKPMLAGKAPDDLSDVNYPVMASPKLDGIRCLMIDGKALTRTFKPIPNDYVREWLEANVPDGLDGELMPRDESVPFKDFSGSVRRKTGEPDFIFMVFDFVGDDLTEPFRTRFELLTRWRNDAQDVGPRLHVVPHYVMMNEEELRTLHINNCASGFEGTMIRDPEGPYKCGRATTKAGQLLKVKDFADEEAVCIAVEELMHNDNEADKDAFGRTKRSAHKENKRAAGTMGALRMKFHDGTEFSVGTGFTAAERQEIWDSVPWPIGQIATIKHQPDPGGRQEGQAPRFPVFVAWRPDGI